MLERAEGRPTVSAEARHWPRTPGTELGPLSPPKAAMELVGTLSGMGE